MTKRVVTIKFFSLKNICIMNKIIKNYNFYHPPKCACKIGVSRPLALELSKYLKYKIL